MTRRARVVLEHDGMDDLLNSTAVRDMLWDQGKAVLALAKSGAPVVSGDYQDSLHISEDFTDRAVVRIGADVPYAMVVEANTGNLARALDGKLTYVTKDGRTRSATQAQIDNWTSR